ncbi:TetR/AcrR family transcriptional regulator [Shimazuella sp. AN120528]|uniref:TetR/AcrR family transcriptional regulator n=1 Tax=Shimazuella soli TaxID=1892854 RepID=UPI001F0F8AC2|nr:TetR/AcrR family transcriptional regulator [Shimazuella soli]MCH5586597.1 TetR/AcrR family transcriptional regulator [Shimazuella soli]
MTTKRIDPRITRTREMLRNALMELIQEKGFEKITVQELTKRAGLYRGTFYLHYQDIYDLFDQSKAEMLKGIREIASDVNPQDFQQQNWLKEPHPQALRMYEYYAEHAAFFRTILGPNGDPSFLVEIKAIMKELFQKNYALFKKNEAQLPIPEDFFISYIVSANLGLLQHWFETDMVYSPREIALMSMRMRLGLFHTTGF